jgi:hypothetical protein
MARSHHLYQQNQLHGKAKEIGFLIFILNIIQNIFSSDLLNRPQSDKMQEGNFLIVFC